MKKVEVGINDLKTTHPQLVFEWNYEKNGNIKPSDVITGSGDSYWWICENGHEWEAQVCSRKKGKGCPHCKESKGEKVIASFLDDCKINYRGQNIIKERGYLRDDFAILSSSGDILATIEYNGEQHYKPVDFAGNGLKWAKNELKITQERDQKKTSWLKEHNIPQLIIPYWEFDNISVLVEDFLKTLKLA